MRRDPPRSGDAQVDSPPQLVRRAEVIGVLALATDLGTGMPLDHSLRTCLVSLAIGQRAGLSSVALGDLYHLSLLRMLGCTADARLFAEVLGDEVAVSGSMSMLDLGDHLEVMLWMLTSFSREDPPLRRARKLARAMTFGSARTEAIGGHCEVAQMLSDRLGFGPEVRQGLLYTYERWDGKGVPRGRRGEDIPLAMRILLLARDLEIFGRAGGVSACRELLRRRSGRAYDPALCDLAAERLTEILSLAETLSPWDDLLAAEPRPVRNLSGTDLDAALLVVADFVDLKSPFTLGHSRAVAELAGKAASHLSLNADGLERAALIHDLGRVAISSGIWDKPGPLSETEWEKVRLYTYYTERCTSRAVALSTVANIAGLHRERLDGSGYHRGLAGSSIPITALLLGTADAFQSMTEPRPHRPAREATEAAAELRREVRAGRLDPDAVAAVLAAAGAARPEKRRAYPAGLTEREVDVLRLVARGLSTKAIAQALVVSEKTVEHHISHIYDKVGVTTRAGATLFAATTGLLR